MDWSTIGNWVWIREAFWTAMKVALAGMVLAWILRPLIARHLPDRLGALVHPLQKRLRMPASGGNAAPDPRESPGSAAPLAPAAFVKAAYTRETGGDPAPKGSSHAQDTPISAGGEVESPSCPPELSRRIDRIEVKVRARRAVTRG